MKKFTKNKKIVFKRANLNATLVLAIFSSFGCQYHAVIDVTVADKITKEIVTGARVRDARNNQYLMLAPGKFILSNYSQKPLPIPLVIDTFCGNTYYQMFLVDKWTASQEIEFNAKNSILFEVDTSKETCRKN